MVDWQTALHALLTLDTSLLPEDEKPGVGRLVFTVKCVPHGSAEPSGSFSFYFWNAEGAWERICKTVEGRIPARVTIGFAPVSGKPECINIGDVVGD